MCKIVQCSILAVLSLLAVGCAAGISPGGAAWNMLPAPVTGLPGLARLVEDFPDSGSARLRLVNAQLEAGELSAAHAGIELLLARGYHFGAGAEAALLAMYSGEQAERLAHAFAQGAAPVNTSRLAAEVDAEALLIEAALHDPATGNLYATSVVSRALFVRMAEGGWRKLAMGDAGSLSGIALDAPRGLIWLAAGVFDQTPDPASAFRGLIALDRATLAERGRFAAPPGVSLADLALAPNGDVIASDPVGGGVYRLRQGAGQMDALVEPGVLRSPQGIAISPDGARVYVSDYRYGLALIARDGISRVASQASLWLDGIDGLWWHDGELIAVQNGTSPLRIVALTLAADGREVTAWRVLEQANPAWTEPLSGAIDGDELVYVGTGQWDRFGAGGALNPGAIALPTQIRHLPLGESRINPR